MPIISQFYGIYISIYFKDHNPPHFHVAYNDYRAALRLNDLKIVEGELPSRVRYLVIEWANLHHSELLENWALAAAGKPVNKIEPLE